MVNKRLIELAKRQKNPSLPAERQKPANQSNPSPQTTANFSANPSESFIMSYDGEHGDYFQELIAKSNERFSGTRAEILTGTSGEVQNMDSLRRMGLISTISNDSNLRSAGLYPITATQSEVLLKDGKLTNPQDNWEALGLVLYDRSQEGYNPKEAQAIYDSLKAHRQDLGLSESDLENGLVVVNPGAEVDSSMFHGVKPIIVPGVTQVYQHEVLDRTGKIHSFKGYGLNGGLPLLDQLLDQLVRGKRSLFMPDETEDIGLRVLCRNKDRYLVAEGKYLADCIEIRRVNFARSVVP